MKFAKQQQFGQVSTKSTNKAVPQHGLIIPSTFLVVVWPEHKKEMLNQQQISPNFPFFYIHAFSSFATALPKTQNVKKKKRKTFYINLSILFESRFIVAPRPPFAATATRIRISSLYQWIYFTLLAIKFNFTCFFFLLVAVEMNRMQSGDNDIELMQYISYFAKTKKKG